MNLKRFTARTSREALALVRQAFGEDAVVMSTRPCAEGVEVLAMAPEMLQQIERLGAQAERHSAADAPVAPARAALRAQAALQRGEPQQQRRTAERVEPRFDARADGRAEPRFEPPLDAPGTASAPAAARAGARPAPVRSAAPARAAQPAAKAAVAPDVAQDVEQLQMSTLSFQDYVRQRMLKRREAELAAEALAEPVRPVPSVVAPIEAARARHLAAQREAGARRELPVLREELRVPDLQALGSGETAAPARPATPRAPAQPRKPAPALADATTPQDQLALMGELRAMRGLIEQRFGALAFMEKLQRQPRQAQLSQRLLDAGFSPVLTRKLVESLPVDVEELNWATGVLERNLLTGEREAPLEDQGGIYAMIGATGVGKTTSTAKLAAAFATRHGAANLGLVTLDAYRVAAHEQLRAYGRILGVPVHTAHDRASLEDLLDLLSGKRLVLIDTAGMAQRDSRTAELLEMLSHASISRLLVVNASAQGETIEDQLSAYGAAACKGVVLSKLDEAVKLGPALDSMIRHKLRVLAVANGQRVPEDWHRLSAAALVQRALKAGSAPAWRLDDGDMNLLFAALPVMTGRPAASLGAV